MHMLLHTCPGDTGTKSGIMAKSILLLAPILACCSQAFLLPALYSSRAASITAPRSRSSGRAVVNMGLFDGFGGNAEREAQKEEDFRRQQEILRQRQNPKAQQKYFQEVNKRRQEVSDNVNEKFNLAKGGQDPMIKWMELKKAGKIPEREKYEGVEDTRGIIIPSVPFGLPKYDNGERFDLRLPYVDDGYVDPDASLGNTFARLFGMGKARKPTTIPNEIPAKKPIGPSSKKTNSPPPKQGPSPPPPSKPQPKKWW